MIQLRNQQEFSSRAQDCCSPRGKMQEAASKMSSVVCSREGRSVMLPVCGVKFEFVPLLLNNSMILDNDIWLGLFIWFNLYLTMKAAELKKSHKTELKLAQTNN